jgi:hypothetical protein
LEIVADEAAIKHDYAGAIFNFPALRLLIDLCDELDSVEELTVELCSATALSDPFAVGTCNIDFSGDTAAGKEKLELFDAYLVAEQKAGNPQDRTRHKPQKTAGSSSSSSTQSRCLVVTEDLNRDKSAVWVCKKCKTKGQCQFCGSRLVTEEAQDKLGACHDHLFATNSDKCRRCGADTQSHMRKPFLVCSECVFGDLENRCCCLTPRP